MQPKTLAAIVLLLLTGCSGSPPAAAKVSVRRVDAAALHDVLAEHRGQVVLVDFWATWCEPCVALFPHTVELHRKFAPRGLAVMAVSMDDPDEEPTVVKFLTAAGATSDNFISRYGVGSESFEAFGLSALPQLRLYDRQGTLRQSFGGDGKPIDPQQIDRAVEELLAAPGGNDLR